MSVTPTQEEIGRALGLNRRTVAAALNGNGHSWGPYPQASEQTVALVQQAAAEMGYQSLDERPSMTKIGKALGVSHVTVRNALRGTGVVSEELTAKIVATAAEMGYELPPLKKRSRGGRW